MTLFVHLSGGPSVNSGMVAYTKWPEKRTSVPYRGGGGGEGTWSVPYRGGRGGRRSLVCSRRPGPPPANTTLPGFCSTA